MYKSKLIISTKSKKILVNFLNKFLKDNDKVYCRAFKRKVDLSKLPEAITERKRSSTHRLQRFSVAIDILKHERIYKISLENKDEFEICGLDRNWKEIIIHLREELTSWKDKVLYFISCF